MSSLKVSKVLLIKFNAPLGTLLLEDQENPEETFAITLLGGA